MNIIRQTSYTVDELPEFWADVHADRTIGLSGVDYCRYTLEDVYCLAETLMCIAGEIEQGSDGSEQSGQGEETVENEGTSQLFFIFDDEEDESL
jgi:hypothetical protein